MIVLGRRSTYDSRDVCKHRIKLLARAGVRGRRVEVHKVLLRELFMREIRMLEIDVHVLVVLFAAIARDVVAPNLDEGGVYSSALGLLTYWIWSAVDILGKRGIYKFGARTIRAVSFGV